ncbi:hypothetical protein DMH03_13060 [Amycolatopsis sp. WAC 01376]|uniref:hypothetical protein n=1 Tax=Amycolatopsis sp. WAC 01376 TaxID=2203195 RepID=UPI000F7ACAA6|nr:hypothetical protein [Amycolatopsis sp. WAC 01376]RSM62970.1 hypothetical protein DMH03_13060 [Amycolatopsis sp. WAC 01376]
MAYVMTFSNTKLADSFFEAAFWLNEPGQDGVNVLAITAELELEDEQAGTPEVHHLTLCYSDGNEPAEAAALAAYRARHGRQL